MGIFSKIKSAFQKRKTKVAARRSTVKSTFQNVVSSVKSNVAARQETRSSNRSSRKISRTNKKTIRQSKRAPAKAARRAAISNEQGEVTFKSRMKNVKEVMGAAINPFRKDRINANVGSKFGKKALEVVGNNPYAVAGVAAGAATAVAKTSATFAARSASIKGATSAVKSAPVTAVSRSLQVGKAPAVAKNTAQTIAVNTKNVAKTESWLKKVYVGSKITLKNPKTAVAAVRAAAVGGLIASIGSYPFAGFIKEEALQTIGFGVASATKNGDWEGAEEAMELQRAILDPSVWDQIKAKIPFVNVLTNLNKFYDAARIKMSIDEQVIEDLKYQEEFGETDEQYWDRVNADRAAFEAEQRQADLDYEATLIQMRADAAAEGRSEDLKYWDSLLAKQEESLKKKKQIELDYWTEYYKTVMDIKGSNSGSSGGSSYEPPSNLNFGLL